MGDYFAGRIDIGGKMSRSDLIELIAFILSHKLQKDYGEVWQKEELEGEFSIAAYEKETVRVIDDQARYGEFPELEAWLIEHKIPFDRHSYARYEYDGVNTYCRIDGNKVVLKTFYSTKDGADLLDKGCIGTIINGNKLSDTEKVNQMKGIINQVKPLPPIEIV